VRFFWPDKPKEFKPVLLSPSPRIYICNNCHSISFLPLFLRHFGDHLDDTLASTSSSSAHVRVVCPISRAVKSNRNRIVFPYRIESFCLYRIECRSNRIKCSIFDSIRSGQKGEQEKC
jgi:hypothetical protein